VQNIAADLKVSASPSAANTPGQGKAADIQESLRSSVAALMVPHSDTAKKPAAAPPATSSASQAPGQQADPFASLFQ